MTCGSSTKRGWVWREVGSGGSRRPNRLNKYVDTRDGVDGKYIRHSHGLIDYIHADSVYECSLPQRGPTHDEFFIDYLEGISVTVHVRMCDISANLTLG